MPAADTGASADARLMLAMPTSDADKEEQRPRRRRSPTTPARPARRRPSAHHSCHISLIYPAITALVADEQAYVPGGHVISLLTPPFFLFFLLPHHIFPQVFAAMRSDAR
jgi:hypothetical protein